jgi:pimeloyl-ACP methyl ester carboxylesterase
MTLHLRTYGIGPAVLWIHGYTMDSSVWEPLWRRLPGWRHIGVDLPGHGGSDPLRPGRTLPGLAAELAEIAAKEGARRVVAESIGSMVALHMAIDDRGDLDRLIVSSPTIAGAPAEPGTDRRYRELITLARMGASGEQLADLWMQSPPDIFRGTERHPATRGRLRGVVARHSWRELRDGAMYALSRHVHTDEALAGIRADTLVMIGDEDMPTFKSSARRLEATVRRCRVLPVRQAGHLCMIERPAAVAAAIAAHLSMSKEPCHADS